MAIKRFDLKTFLEHVGDGKTVAAHRAGAVIIEQGSEANTICYLQSGKAKESVSRHGKDAVIGILERGRFFGTTSLDGSKRLTTVTAITPCVVTTITNEAMKEAMQCPSFAQLFADYLFRRNNSLKVEKIDLMLNNRQRRLAQTLLALARSDEGQKPQTIGPEITQELLAEMIGATRQRANFFLNRFRNLGYIQYNDDGITVLPDLRKALLRGHSKADDETEG